MCHYPLARLSLSLSLSLSLIANGLNIAPAVAGFASRAQAAETTPTPQAPHETVRRDMFKLLDPALMKELLAAKNYPEAQSRIDQAGALPNPTPYETFVLNRTRAAFASRAGNSAMAVTALQALIESGRLSPADRIDFILALGINQYNTKDYPKAIITFTQYQSESGDDAKVRPYLVRAYYLDNEFEQAKRALLGGLQIDEKTGNQPALEDLQLLANSSSKTKDMASYLSALEKLVQYYPSDDYWTDLLSRLPDKPGYSNHLQLDVYRLKRMVLAAMTAADYVDMGELALQAGFPSEAKKVADAGYAANVLGTGSNAPRHQKLREQANRGAARDGKNIAADLALAEKAQDGNGLINVGYTYVAMDQFDKGIGLIQKGLGKGQLKHPEEAKMRLGESYAMAGRKEEALKAFENVKGIDGTGDLAHYWIYYLNRPAAAPATR